MAEETVLQLLDVHKSYSEGEQTRPILQGVTFDVRRGEIVGLRGRSGSGKSTLLNLISGIDLPDAGSVNIAGENLTGYSDRARTLFRRKHIGIIFQAFNLVPTLTVLENVLLPLQLNGATGNSALPVAMNYLEEVGLQDRSAAYPDRLSGGEQQRIAIVRALVHDPDLILADEPTGNLDEQTGEAVLDLFERLVRRRGKTMLLVSHDADLLSGADRVLALHNGQLTGTT